MLKPSVLAFLCLLSFPNWASPSPTPNPDYEPSQPCLESFDLPRQCSAHNTIEESDTAWEFVEKFKWDAGENRLRSRANFALGAMIKYAAFRMLLKGYKKQSIELVSEWENNWDNYLLRVGRDVGDHKPLSQWLSKKYTIIEFILGKEVCRWTRLNNIQTLNHTIPVVFSCLDKVDSEEYRRHFIPFSGTINYWGSFFACTGLTWGAGVIGIICGPVSLAVEYLTEAYVAPAISPTAWRFVCN